MTDAELIAECLAFRSGILAGRKSGGMCAVVCLALGGYLSGIVGIKVDIIQGVTDIDAVEWCNHVWLRMPDGRVLDPTMDQFNEAMGEHFPAVYLGKPHPVVHQEPQHNLIDPGKIEVPA